MIDKTDIKNILVLDIETVPQFAAYGEMPDAWKELWKKKMSREIRDGLAPEGLYERAGIYAEFGKIICICAGYFYDNGDGLSFKVKAFYGDDEKQILCDFIDMLNRSFNAEEHMLCGHNSREFDFPYIARRCLVNGLQIPFLLNNAGKKPWEVKLIDTMDYWKFGDYKSYTSVDLLANVFGIESPKNGIDGSQVCGIYWNDKDIERIKIYCMKDVVTVAQLLLRFKGMELLKEEKIAFVN